MKIRIDNVRLAFTNLFEARAGDSDKPDDKKYSCASIYPDADPIVTVLPSDKEKEVGVKPCKAKFSVVIEEVAKEKWGAKAGEILKALRAGGKTCVSNGDSKSQYEGYAGNYFTNASNKVRPKVVDNLRNPLTAADGKPYAGCFANVTVDVWAQENKFGKRVNASLLGVQFKADGDAFAGGASGSEEDFEEIAEGADASDLG